jgi:hypothetical protein
MLCTILYQTWLGEFCLAFVSVILYVHCFLNWLILVEIPRCLDIARGYLLWHLSHQQLRTISVIRMGRMTYSARGICYVTYEGVSKSFRTGRLEREPQMAQPSATRFSCTILWVSLVSFAAITLCVASHRVITKANKRIFRYDSVRKLLDTPS